MLSLIQKWCEYAFPERADHKLVRLAKPDDVIRLLWPTTSTEFISLLDFKEPLIRALIHEAKFQGNEKAFDLLALALSGYLKHQPTGAVLVPIPLSRRRQKERGYNQVHEVAKRAAANAPHVTIQNGLLRRVKDTVSQTTLDRKDRLKNMDGAFTANARPLRDAHIIVLDDVATTGATLKAARLALMPLKPASITLLSLAH